MVGGTVDDVDGVDVVLLVVVVVVDVVDVVVVVGTVVDVVDVVVVVDADCSARLSTTKSAATPPTMSTAMIELMIVVRFTMADDARSRKVAG